MPSDAGVEDLVERIAGTLIARHQRLTTAESCTGGWIAKSLTDQPGSSAWFEYGFVCYGNNAKIDMLDIQPALINEFGAVSREVAESLANSARRVSGADLAVAVTGIAGPDGGTPDKPVGTVWFAWAGPGEALLSHRERFDGDRDQVRRLTVAAALAGVLAQLAGR
jgi:nicotinamide-nucleotide amidase